MQKMKSLRKALNDAVPQILNNPEMMRIFADEGISMRVSQTRCLMKRITP